MLININKIKMKEKDKTKIYEEKSFIYAYI